MKKRYAIWLLILLPVMTGYLTAGGRVVLVTTDSGGMYFGELLSVRPQEILFLSYQTYVTDSVLETNPSLIHHIPVSRIVRVESKGESRVSKGILIGTLVGIGAGISIALISESQDNEQTNVPGGFLIEPVQTSVNAGLIIGGCLIGGLLIGAAVGAGSSAPDIEADFLIDRQSALNSLIEYSRYATGEPAFLRNL